MYCGGLIHILMHIQIIAHQIDLSLYEYSGAYLNTLVSN